MKSETALAGIDIGTSGVKVVLLTPEGRLLASAGSEYPLHTPQSQWAEQNPDDWLAGALNGLRAVLAQSGIRPGDIAAVGMTGQMHSLVCLGADSRPLRPAIIWADRRSAEQVARAQAEIGSRLGAWAGNPVATGFMLTSWAWLRQHEPLVAGATRTLLLPKDEVRFRLTGLLASEPSDASATLLFDVSRRDWSVPLLAWAGLQRDQLPPLLESAQAAGTLLPEMAAACGLLAGTPVICGASDQAAQAVWQGVIAPGTASVTVGTGGQIFAPLSTPVPDPQLRLHLFCHALPNRWHLEAAMLSAGLALRWFRDRFAPGSSYAELADAAAQVAAAGEGLFFLPYLSGERTPHMDSGARAGFTGLGLEHTRAHLVRAVMEGVVFALKQGLDRMEAITGRLETLVVSGGAVRHPLWLRLLADILDRRLLVPAVEEATAGGAALLAGVGAGLFPDLPRALAARRLPPAREIRPDPDAAARYRPAY
ncbi:MAG TPA: xylulokinase, partial [Anaerolineaceae bacterium]|nr:xylulokinase [Anaerolineaceae bacterium]